MPDDLYGYHILTVTRTGSGAPFNLHDYGPSALDQDQALSDITDVAWALTERGQQGWRLAHYSPASDGWPCGMYLLERVGPESRTPASPSSRVPRAI
jgi:hypothetical protein